LIDVCFIVSEMAEILSVKDTESRRYFYIHFLECKFLRRRYMQGVVHEVVANLECDLIFN